MNRHQLEQTLRRDADKLMLPHDTGLQQRIRQAVMARTQAQHSTITAPSRSPGMRLLLAISAAAFAAALLLIILPTRTPVPPTQPAVSVANNASTSTTVQLLEQQLQRQLVSNEQMLLQELQHIDQDWQRTKNILLPAAMMK